LSPRLVRTVTGVTDFAAHERPAAMANALLEHLTTLDADACSEAPPGELPVFIRYDDERALALTRSAIAAGTEGWGVLMSPTRVSAPAGSRAQGRFRAGPAVPMSRSLRAFGPAVLDDRF